MGNVPGTCWAAILVSDNPVLGFENTFEDCNESLKMMVKVPAAVDRHGMTISKVLQIFRELDRRWHLHATDEDWNNRYISSKSGLHLDPDRVRFVVDPVFRALSPTKPLRSNDH